MKIGLNVEALTYFSQDDAKERERERDDEKSAQLYFMHLKKD